MQVETGELNSHLNLSLNAALLIVENWHIKSIVPGLYLEIDRKELGVNPLHGAFCGGSLIIEQIYGNYVGTI